MTTGIISADRLREVLDYDPATGVFTWLVRTSTRIHIGDTAGRIDGKGYWRIRIDGREYAAHRLAVLYMSGAWPADQVDHRDCNRLNNAWSNLREATQAQNNANTRPRGALGIKGVRRCASSGRYLAEIVSNRKTKYLGSFKTPEEAHRAYLHAARMFHGEFVRAG